MTIPLVPANFTPYYLYRITCSKNGKIYIGQTIDPDNRWRQHKQATKENEPDMVISRAMKRHDIENFQFEVIATCWHHDNANDMEAILIKQYESHVSLCKGYNVAWGGMNAPVSEKTRKLLSKIFKGQHLSPKTEFKKGHQHSPEVLQRIAAKLKGRTAWNKGKKTNLIPWNKGIIGQSKYTLPDNETLLLMIAKYGFTKTSHQLQIRVSAIRAYINRYKLEYIHPNLSELTQFKSGIDHPNAKLTPELVLQIVALHNEGNHTQEQLGRLFNVSRMAIKNVINGRNWSHITQIEYISSTKKAKQVSDPNNCNAKTLTSQQVLEIIALYNSGAHRKTDLAKQFQVSQSLISMILSGQSWSKTTGIKYQPKKKKSDSENP